MLEQAQESHEEEIRLAADRHEEAMDALRESDERRANPGDYECPHCRYISLKRYATRCPLCRESPDSEYWNRVEKREERERERAKAAAEERVRLAKIAAEKHAAEAEQRQRQEQEAAAKEAAERRSLGLFALALLAIAGIFAWSAFR